MERELVEAFLEAFAVGDAFGKSTEYCSRQAIEKKFNRIDTILDPQTALSHRDLSYGRVTDDTEQNVYLIKEYARQGSIDATDTAKALLKWVDETDAVHYMGPSSMKALRAIRDGKNIGTAGIEGTTCGGIMRVPAAFLFSTPETLEENVIECLKPTHFTAVAIEAAMAYAYALQAAFENKNIHEIIERACEGARIGLGYGNTELTAGVGPSVATRALFLERTIPSLKSEHDLKCLLYDVIGSTLASADVAACVFGLLLYAKSDVRLAIRLATETGGDTDTIASLAAGLCTIYGKGHNLDTTMVQLVSESNNLDFGELAKLVTNGGAL